MKKLSIATLLLAAVALTASAQMSLVKQAKSSFKPGGDYKAFVEKITPAFTDPETAELAETWYTAGKAGFDEFDYSWNLYRLGQNVDQGAMSQALVKGYEFYQKALPLDQVPDAKGKVKPKFTKNIVKDIAAHHNDFNNAGIMLYGADDFPGAYEAWTIYLQIPNDPALGKDAPKMPHDTIVSTINFNRGLAAWRADRVADALEAFDEAIQLNYDDPQIYEIASDLARQLGKTDKQLEYAQKGFDKSGNTNFLRVIINSYIDKEDYAGATNLINQSIASATEPDQIANLKVLKGIILENTDPEAVKGSDEVIGLYRDAMQLCPNYGAAFYNYGRILFNKANTLDEANTLQGAQYNEFKKNTLAPILTEAAENIEKGYNLDNSLTNAPSLLQQIYYFLGDEENLNRVKETYY